MSKANESFDMTGGDPFVAAAFVLLVALSLLSYMMPQGEAPRHFAGSEIEQSIAYLERLPGDGIAVWPSKARTYSIYATQAGVAEAIASQIQQNDPGHDYSQRSRGDIRMYLINSVLDFDVMLNRSKEGPLSFFDDTMVESDRRLLQDFPFASKACGVWVESSRGEFIDRIVVVISTAAAITNAAREACVSYVLNVGAGLPPLTDTDHSVSTIATELAISPLLYVMFECSETRLPGETQGRPTRGRVYPLLGRDCLRDRLEALTTHAN